MTSSTRDTIREPLRTPWDVIRAHSPLYAGTQRDIALKRDRYVVAATIRRAEK